MVVDKSDDSDRSLNICRKNLDADKYAKLTTHEKVK